MQTSILHRHQPSNIDSSSSSHVRYAFMSISSSSSSIHHCWIITDIHSILAAFSLQCSNHRLQLQHTNINTDIISSSMRVLTYLSASSIHPSYSFHLRCNLITWFFIGWSSPCTASNLLVWRMMWSEWRSRVWLEAGICWLDGVGCCIIVTARPILLLHHEDHCMTIVAPPSYCYTWSCRGLLDSDTAMCTYTW